MKVNFEEHVQLYEQGFKEDDLLGRQKTSEALSDLLNRIEDPLVVALDGDWGTGKSYFLKRWVGEHLDANKDGAIVVYFDAFSHDYLTDPLPALVSALEKRISTGDSNMRRIKRAAYKIAKPLARTGLATVTSGLSEMVSSGNGIVKTLGNQVEKNLKQYWQLENQRLKSMKQFRSALESITSFDDGKKVVFVIDELDRCRPDYALEVLEVIKHFFTVPRVQFVLGVNLTALENMVSVRYGKNIDASTYLQKFIQVKLKLPNEVAFDRHKYRDVLIFLDNLLKKTSVPEHIEKSLLVQVELVARKNPISLRQIEQIVSVVNLASSEVYSNKDTPLGKIYVMNDLIISKVVRPDLYPKFLNATISSSELKSYLGTPNYEIEFYNERGLNPYVNNEARKLYYSWLFLAQDQHFEEEDKGFQNDIIASFCTPQGLIDMKRLDIIPSKIQSEWLEFFQCYKPNPTNNRKDTDLS
ncbi:MAG: P-loop NTPase fold protein [Rhodobacteraceae bacterium]|nr:P-loop NTPase fold protein [Paracoccaceae bacterium]